MDICSKPIRNPSKGLYPQVRLVKDNDSNYSIGVIFNPQRLARPYQKIENTDGCKLCSELKDCDLNPYKNLAPEISKNFIVTYNAFPHAIGSSLALAKNINGKEKPMYNTKNLDGLALELYEISDIADKVGLRFFHNNFGAGASIPSHEHWHLFNSGSLYDDLGEKYGFDAAEKISSKKQNDTKIMPDFPFAHLIFDAKDPERIVFFLKNLGDKMGINYPYQHVPHSICQGEDGVLIVPNKVHRDKCYGSFDVAGHYLGCKSLEEFENMDFKEYISKFEEILFKKEDIDLETFL